MFLEVTSSVTSFVLKIQHFEFTNCHLAWHQDKNVSVYASPSLNVSSILGDVFVHICTVSRVKSKRFHRKVNSRCFCWFPAAILVDQSGPPACRFHTKLYKVACHASANNSETTYHKDVRPGEVVYVLVFYNILLFLAYFIERLFYGVTVKTIYCLTFSTNDCVFSLNKFTFLRPHEMCEILVTWVVYILSDKYHFRETPHGFLVWSSICQIEYILLRKNRSQLVRTGLGGVDTILLKKGRGRAHPWWPHSNTVLKKGCGRVHPWWLIDPRRPTVLEKGGGGYSCDGKSNRARRARGRRRKI